MEQTDKIKTFISRSDQRGISLVEVIVTLLVGSIIALAVASLLSISTRCYSLASAENTLIKEAQIAQNQIETLLRKAVSYEYTASAQAQGKEVSKLLIQAYEQDADGNESEYYYAFILLKEQQLLCLDKISSTELAAKASPHNDPLVWLADTANEQASTTEPLLCASYVTSMNISPEKNQSNQSTLTQITLNLQFQEQTFSSSGTVALRN